MISFAAFSNLFNTDQTGSVDIEIVHENNLYKVVLAYCKLPSLFLEKFTNELLSDYEQQFAIMHRTGKQRDYYKAGRIAAKMALTQYAHENDPKKIEIHNGIHGQPIIVNSKPRNIQVSISHCTDIAVAVVFPEEIRIGVDIENVFRYKPQYIDRLLSKNEQNLLKTLQLDKEILYFALWTMHEAMGKTLKTGITTIRELFEIIEIHSINNQFLKGTFKNFPNHEGISMFIENWCLSLVLPSQTDFRFV